MVGAAVALGGMVMMKSGYLDEETAGVETTSHKQVEDASGDRKEAAMKRARTMIEPKGGRGGPGVSRAGVEGALKATGWMSISQGSWERGEAFSRQSVVYRKGRMDVEVIWIHARSLDVLRGLEEQVRAEDQVVGLGHERAVVLRARRGGTVGVGEMGRMLVKYRELVSSERSP